MEISQYHVTQHAAQRMAQRNLTPQDVATVLRHGRKRYCAGAKFHFLGTRNLPLGQERETVRLVGTVIVTDGPEIITVYRHKNAWRDIKHKAKRNLRTFAESPAPLGVVAEDSPQVAPRAHRARFASRNTAENAYPSLGSCGYGFMLSL